MARNGRNLKKALSLRFVNEKLIDQQNRWDCRIDFVRVEEAEMDEQWSYVGNTSNQRWLWHAINHVTGKVLAYVFGKRKDTVFKKLQALLVPFGLKRLHTDDWGAYERNIDEKLHEIAKPIPRK